MLRTMILLAMILFCSIIQAASLNDTLSRLDHETLTAELWALECVMMAQKGKVITADCYSAEHLVKNIDNQLIALVNLMTQDSSINDGPQFYSAIKKIKHFRARLQKVNENLNLAKKITGRYHWSWYIAPSFYQQN